MKEDKKRKKKHKNEIKGTIGRTNPFSFLVIQFPPPIDDPLILLLPPSFFLFRYSIRTKPSDCNA